MTAFTPAQIEQLRREIALAVKAAVEPLKTELASKQSATLREPKYPSATHRDFGVEKLRESQSEIEARFSETVLALEARDKNLVRALEGLTKRVELMETGSLVEVEERPGSKSMVPAGPVAAKAAVATEGRTAAIEVAANRADEQSLAARVAANRATIVNIFTFVLLALWNAYQAIVGHR